MTAPLPPPLTDHTGIAGTIPDYPAPAWQALPARAATLAAWTTALSTLVPFGVFAVVAALADPASTQVYLAVAALALVLVPLTAWLAFRRTRRTRWRLDDNALAVRRDQLWSNDTRVPRARVQHLDIQHGPLQRRTGLATLTVHTAGSQLHALRLTGLDKDEAARIRDLLARPQDHDGL